MGDYVSGGTVYRLTDKTDGGDILRQELVWIKPGWTYHDLWRAIFPVGVRLLVDAVREMERGSGLWVEQDESCATWEPSWDRPRLERREDVYKRQVFDLTKSLKPEPREALLAKRREIAQLPDDEAAPQLRELLKGKGV